VSELISDDARAWIGKSAPPERLEVNRSDIVKYSIATEQQQEKYLNGDEAPPMFLFGLLRPVGRMETLTPDGLVPDNFVPELPLKRVMAGGTKMQLHRAVKPGEVLVAKKSLQDMFEKNGSTGPLIFVVYELKVETEAGEPVLTEHQTRIFR
jgi:3-methylfumaryl-CoA hydratase